MAAEKAWLKAFTSGSKSLQDRLRKVHAKNPEFQSFLGKHGFEGGSSVKQASKAQTVSKEVAAKRTELSDKAYGATTGAKVGGEHGSSDEYKDTTVPLTKDQHSKVQAAKKAALTKDERFAAIARATRKSKTGERYEIPTEDPDDAGYDDMMDLHHSLHIGHGSSLDEEAQKHRIEVTMSNPNHPAVTKRDERFSRVVRVTASNPEKALHAGWDHYKKKGYKVHEAEHIGMVSEASMKGVPYTPEEKDRMLKFERKDLHNAVIDAEDHGTQEEVGKARAALLQHQKDYPHISITSPYSGVTPRVDESKEDAKKINKRVTTRKYEGDDAYSHAVFVDGKPVITGLHKSQVKHYMQQASDKLNEAYPSPLDEPKQVEAREKLKGVLADIKKANPKHPAVAGVKEVMYKGEKVTIPAHKAPKSGFNKYGKFATLDKVPVKEGFDDPKEIAQHLADTHGAKNVRPEHVLELARDSNRAVDVESVMKHIKGLQEEVKQLDEVDMDFVQNFIAGGLALQGIDYAKKKLGDVTKKAYDKYMSKKAKDSAPTQTAVSEASLAADIQRDVDARNKRLADAAAKARKKKIADAKAVAAGKQAKEMENLKNLSKYGSDEEKEYAKGELQRIKGLEEAIKGGIGDVDAMRSFVRGTLPTSCPTCYGRKSMYVTPQGKMYADKKTEDSKRVACPDCQGKGYVAEESNEDSNYLNNKKNQIRESILGKLAAKTGKK